jgi:hypothetical protein
LADSLVQGGERGGSGAGVRFPEVSRAAVAEDFDFKSPRNERGSQREVDDFRSDAGGIADGDENAWHCGIVGLSRMAAKRGNRGMRDTRFFPFGSLREGNGLLSFRA